MPPHVPDHLRGVFFSVITRLSEERLETKNAELAVLFQGGRRQAPTKEASPRLASLM